MSNPKRDADSRKADFQAWEDAAAGDRQTQQERIASEVFLAALGSTTNFRDKIFLKGGILVGAVYESGRNTADLDFSTTLKPTMDFLKRLETEIVEALPSAAAAVGAPNVLIKVQSVKYRPRPDTFVEADTPALDIKFAFADRGSKAEKSLHEGRSSNVIYADISFNEEISRIQEICIGDSGLSFFAYSKCDLFAEKFRSLLQQKTRNRNRRQDVYDLWYLISEFRPSLSEKREILQTFLAKSRSRGIEPMKASLLDSEIIERSRADWDTLSTEVEILPDFDEAYAAVSEFYSELWQL